MADIKPFKGLFYNQDKVDMGKVVTPPYDVIDEAQQARYYELDPYNIIRLILGKDHSGDSSNSNKYTRAAFALKSWQKDGILKQDSKAAFYIYGFDYRIDDDLKHVLGFIPLVKLADFDEGVVLPHEKTFDGPKVDRLNLMKETSANLDQIFSIFSDDSGEIHNILADHSKGEPTISLEDNGVLHRIWPLFNERAIERITELLKGKSLFIADGHHRYETAINYSKLRGASANNGSDNGYEFVPMLLIDINKEPLNILPTHRVIKDMGMDNDDFLERLSESFTVKAMPSLDALMDSLKKVGKTHCFGLYDDDMNSYLLQLKDDSIKDKYLPKEASDEWKSLDAAVLQYIVIESMLGIKVKKGEKSSNITFTDDYKRAAKLVEQGGYQAVFILNATEITQVEAVAKNNEKMPQKSTYFYPKPVTGLVINIID